MDYILTNNGAVMMTQVAAGKTLLFTRTESGSGYSASPAVLQSVVDKKQDMFLNEVTYESKQAVVKSVLSNMQLEEEYQLRQVGVYAKLEGDETDTLLLIGQQYNGEKIPSYHDGIIQIEYNITIKAAGTGNITIEGVGTGYVTKGQFLAHLNDYSNPHKLTAGQIGLGNVPNVDTDDQTPTFMEAEERENIVSGEKVSVILGKIKKWLSDMKAAAFCSVANNLVTTLAGSVLDARQGKELQDQITGLYSELADGAWSGTTPEGTEYTTQSFLDELFAYFHPSVINLISTKSDWDVSINKTESVGYAYDFEIANNAIRLAARSAGGYAGNYITVTMTTKKAYDITHFNKLIMQGNEYLIGYRDYNKAYLIVYLKNKNTGVLITVYNHTTTTDSAISGAINDELDIASITGEHYIVIALNGNNHGTSYADINTLKLST